MTRALQHLLPLLMSSKKVTSCSCLHHHLARCASGFSALSGDTFDHIASHHFTNSICAMPPAQMHQQ